MMSADAINDEILRIKRELAARFDTDLARIVSDAKSRECNAISLPPRRCVSEQGDAVERRNGPVSGGKSTPAAH
ncbi:MAG: hypothetical protein R6U98_13985 [Pirellulaceae bacterium]